MLNFLRNSAIFSILREAAAELRLCADLLLFDVVLVVVDLVEADVDCTELSFTYSLYGLQYE